MKKLLKAEEIKTLFVVDATAYDKDMFEQLIIAAKRSSFWGASTDADITITHCDTVGGTYEAYDVINVAPGAGEVVQFEVNLVGVKQFFKIGIEKIATDPILDVVGILADDRYVEEATSLDLVVNPTPRAVLSLDSYEI